MGLVPACPVGKNIQLTMHFEQSVRSLLEESNESSSNSLDVRLKKRIKDVISAERTFNISCIPRDSPVLNVNVEVLDEDGTILQLATTNKGGDVTVK